MRRVVVFCLLMFGTMQQSSAMFLFSSSFKPSKKTVNQVITDLKKQEYGVIRSKLYPIMNQLAKASNWNEEECAFVCVLKNYIDKTLDVPLLYLWVRFLKDIILTGHYDETIEIEKIKIGLAHKDFMSYATLCLIRMWQDFYSLKELVGDKYSEKERQIFTVLDKTRKKFDHWLKKIWEKEFGKFSSCFYTDIIQKEMDFLLEAKNLKFPNPSYLLTSSFLWPTTINFGVPARDIDLNEGDVKKARGNFCKKFRFVYNPLKKSGKTLNNFNFLKSFMLQVWRVKIDKERKEENDGKDILSGYCVVDDSR